MINGTLLCFQKCPNLGKLYDHLYMIIIKPTLLATDVRKLFLYYLKMSLDPKGCFRAFPVGPVVKNSPSGDMGLIPGPGRPHLVWSN